MKKLDINFFVFIVITGTIGQIAAEIIAPSLPFISKDFRIPDGLAQLAVSYYMLGMAIPAIIFGVLSDRFGRKNILITASLISVCGSLLCFIAPNIHVVIIGRIIQGIGFGGVSGMSITLVMDRFKGVELAKYMSILSVAWSLSIDITPFIGGFLQAVVSWRMIFVMVFLHNLLVLYLSYKYKETYQGHTVAISFNTFRVRIVNVITDRSFATYSILSGLIYAIFMSYIVVTTFIIQDVLHKSSIYYGTFTICLSMIFALSALVNGRMLNKFTIFSLTIFGFTLSVLSGILLLLMMLSEISITQFIYAILPMFIGSAFIFSNVNSLAFSTLKTNIGLASAINSTLKLLLAFFITGIISLSHTANTFILGLVITALSVLALVILCLSKVNDIDVVDKA